MLAAKTWRERTLIQRIEREACLADRYLDFAIEVRVLDKDGSGDYHHPTIPHGSYRLIATHSFGGQLDRLTGEFLGPAKHPLIWHVSAGQWASISQDATAILIKGGEGSGKTECLCLWLMLQVIEHRRCAGGVTAPTTERLDIVWRKLIERLPPRWYVARTKKGEIYFPGRKVTLQFRGTKKYSDATGSRVQGMTWHFHAGDEVQDYDPAVEADIESRGRGAKAGRYYRCNTATPKDHPDWRDYLARCDGNPNWITRTLVGPENIFVPPEHWERLRQALSEREFLRRVMAEDVRPERATYHAFSRTRNLLAPPSPALTEDITRRMTQSAGLVIGHDPGARQQTSVLMRAYHDRKADRHYWLVLDEFITHRETARAHAQALRRYLAERGITNPSDVLVLYDPGQQTDSLSPENVAAVFRQTGFLCNRAAHKLIRKEDRIDVMNNLFASGLGPQLYIALKPSGLPAAPECVRSLELEMRDEAWRAEQARKGSASDTSHCPSAIAYGLYRFEAPRFGYSVDIPQHNGNHE